MSSLSKTVCFITLITVMGVSSLLQTTFSMMDLSSASTIRGATARELESRFDAALPIRDLGVNFWTMIRYVLFRSGENGLVVGRNGWLFSSEEAFSPEFASSNVQRNFETVMIVRDELAHLGIDLVVVPVPSKLRVHGEWSPIQAEATHQTLYPELLIFLEENNINHVDVLEAFSSSEGNFFFKTDTHWLPETASLVADELRQFSISENSEEKFSIATIRESKLQGDLVNFLPLSPWFSFITPQEESVTSREVVANSTEVDLFADLPLPSVALVGTSYSANSKWNFDGSLKLALNEDVLNFAREGEGPIKPMHNFLDEYLQDIPELRLVIWEIPERYLVQPYASREQRKPRLLAANKTSERR